MGSKSYDAMYLSAYRKQNPDKSEQWRINSEIRHLEKLGYKVIEPKRKQPEEMTLEELESIADKRREQNRRYCAEWRKRNRDRINAYQREYSKTHPRTVQNREYRRKWREANKERLAEYRRSWYANHSEQILEKQKLYFSNIVSHIHLMELLQ